MLVPLEALRMREGICLKITGTSPLAQPEKGNLASLLENLNIRQLETTKLEDLVTLRRRGGMHFWYGRR